MNLALSLGVGDLDVFHHPLGKASGPIPTELQFGLEASDHDRVELAPVNFRAHGEALIVEEFKQSGEALFVTVVWGRGEEELALEDGGEAADSLGALRLDRILGTTRRSDVVTFVDDQEVIGARVGCVVSGWQGFSEQPHGALAFEEVDGSDQPGKVGPRVHMDATLASQLSEKGTIHDTELESEFVAHLLLPLYLDGGRTYDEDGAGTVAEDQFLSHEASFDRFPEANVIGD